MSTTTPNNTPAAGTTVVVAAAKNRTVIVAAVDRSPASDAVIQAARGFSQMLGAELHLVHVVRPAPPPIGPMVPAIGESLHEGRAFIDGIAAAVIAQVGGGEENPRFRVVGHLMCGEPYREVLQLASDLEADLVVVGSHGKTMLDRLIAGSVSQSLLQKAHCAVLVARPKDYPESRNVPEIEPPCPQCLATQRESQGEKLWCTQHAGRGIHNHVYNETPPSFAMGSMLIRPNSELG